MSKDLFSQSLRLSYISRVLREIFNLWNYSEIFLPTVESFDESLRDGLKMIYNDRVYLMKPDITSQLLFNLKVPSRHRFFYISEVLRGSISGRWQAGVEFIGGESPHLYVEVLSILLTILDVLNLNEVFVDLGSLKLWEDAVKDIKEYASVVFEALRKRNFGMIEELPIDHDKKDELWELFNFRGRKGPYEKLNEVLEALDDKRVFIDLGTIRFYPYYDDLIFEVYSPKLGRPIGGGGEYRVGAMKACGFALDLNALTQLVEPKFEDGRVKLSGNVASVYREARKFVLQGKGVIVDT
ncbi:MAG: phosphoribosyltransferase regulatory subunit [Thermotogota bacterium]|nr:phosphoribosyltransferase regulatory subunit [Thermotogota bacterium]MDK2864323.1 phosphoribosyltransferase regulatory subunit [Thermotogota bacterium]HCZ06343.1 ATP phosphoribosyltransferase regulatory subunit [Thermotogota bacterium]